MLLHPKKDIFVKLDETVDSRDDEADRFAADWLIPPNTWQLVRQLRLKSAMEIENFAKKYRIAPGVLVGRMQRGKVIPWKNLNRLKTKLNLEGPRARERWVVGRPDTNPLQSSLALVECRSLARPPFGSRRSG